MGLQQEYLVSNFDMVKNNGLKMKAKASGKKHGSNSENIDEDEALRQAIALSLQDSAAVSNCSNKNVVSVSKAEKKGNIHIQEDTGRKKNKKLVCIEFAVHKIIFPFYKSAAND
ncbi:Ubiquitin interacting motif [Sesbania bispinosa]|nr:Ubiquitin interacting motif [Sesbania bispinosa]